MNDINHGFLIYALYAGLGVGCGYYHHHHHHHQFYFKHLTHIHIKHKNIQQNTHKKHTNHANTGKTQ